MSSLVSKSKDSKQAMGLKERMKQVHPLMVLLVISFALSSWIDMYGLWVEVPILVHKLPEGWTLPSYIIIIIELAVLSPVMYTLINKIWPGNFHRREVIMAYIIMCTGFLALVFMTFFWQYTVWVAGAERSVPILVLILFLSIVDTTSCVVYMPYMARFSEIYMPAYIAGEEMGGLITGIVGLIQGAGGETTCYNETKFLTNATTGENYTETVFQVSVKEPLFSPSVFFVFLACMMLVSIAAFSILNFSSFAKRRAVKDVHSKELNVNDKEKQPPKDKIEISTLTESEDLLKGSATENPKKTMEKRRFLFCLFSYLLAAFLVFSFFPSIQSYSTLPYGAMAYTLALRIGSVVNPLAAFTAFLLPVRSLPILATLIAFSSSLVGYHVFLATQSPAPPLQFEAIGSVIVIVTGPMVTGFFAYTRACIAALLRTEGGHNALFYAGAFLQVGACLGGLLGFVLVNVLQVFTSIPPCA